MRAAVASVCGQLCPPPAACVHVHACACMHIHVRACACMCMHAHTGACMCIHVCVHMHACACMCMHVTSLWASLHGVRRTYMHAYAYAYMCMRICVYAYMRIRVCVQHAHAHARVHMHAYAYVRMMCMMRPNAPAQAWAYTHTYTHTYAQAWASLPSCMSPRRSSSMTGARPSTARSIWTRTTKKIVSSSEVSRSTSTPHDRLRSTVCGSRRGSPSRSRARGHPPHPSSAQTSSEQEHGQEGMLCSEDGRCSRTGIPSLSESLPSWLRGRWVGGGDCVPNTVLQRARARGRPARRGKRSKWVNWQT